MKKFTGIALAGAIGFSGLGLMGASQASAAEPTNPSYNMNLLEDKIQPEVTWSFGEFQTKESPIYTVDSNKGDKVNFWVNRKGSEVEMRIYKQNKNTGSFVEVYDSKNSGNASQILKTFDVYETAKYKVKFYTVSGSAAQFSFSARVY